MAVKAISPCQNLFHVGSVRQVAALAQSDEVGDALTTLRTNPAQITGTLRPSDLFRRSASPRRSGRAERRDRAPRERAARPSRRWKGAAMTGSDEVNEKAGKWQADMEGLQAHEYSDEFRPGNSETHAKRPLGLGLEPPLSGGKKLPSPQGWRPQAHGLGGGRGRPHQCFPGSTPTPGTLSD